MILVGSQHSILKEEDISLNGSKSITPKKMAFPLAKVAFSLGTIGYIFSFSPFKLVVTFVGRVGADEFQSPTSVR